MAEIASIVVFTEHLQRSVAFYRALGVPLEDEDHGDGLVHAAGDMNGVHVAVLPASSAGAAGRWTAAGSTFVGLWVPSLDAALAALQPLGAEVLREHEDCEWGCRVIVADPDGRAVEVNQRDHCAHPAGG
jgi:predicted enzyme related to lactoylglutathione lyase